MNEENRGQGARREIKNQNIKCKFVESRLRRDVFLKDPSAPLGRDDAASQELRRGRQGAGREIKNQNVK